MSIYENNALTLTQSKKSEPRIPFGWLIERKLIEPGTILYDQKENTLQKLEQMVLLLVRKTLDQFIKLAQKFSLQTRVMVGLFGTLTLKVNSNRLIY